MNEANTCRTNILPKLKDALWEEDAILEQVILTPGRIVLLNIGSLRKFKSMLLPLEEQRQLVAYLDRSQAQVSHLRLIQEETRNELRLWTLPRSVLACTVFYQ